MFTVNFSYLHDNVIPHEWEVILGRKDKIAEIASHTCWFISNLVPGVSYLSLFFEFSLVHLLWVLGYCCWFKNTKKMLYQKLFYQHCLFLGQICRLRGGNTGQCRIDPCIHNSCPSGTSCVPCPDCNGFTCQRSLH